MSYVAGQAIREIIGATRSAELAQDLTRRQGQNRTEDLEDRVAELSLVCEALWSLLSETSGLHDQQLLDRIREIDLHDGVLDRRKAHPSATCTECGSKVPNNADICVFCSAAPPPRNPFSS